MLKQITVFKVKKKSLLKKLEEKERQLRRIIPRIAFGTRMRVLNAVSTLMKKERAIVQALEETERLFVNRLKFNSKIGANDSRYNKKRAVEKVESAVQKARNRAGRAKPRSLRKEKMSAEIIEDVERAVERARKREWKYWREGHGKSRAVQSHHARKIAKNRQRPTKK